MLMIIEYEKPIDTVEDMLQSEMNLYIPSDTPLKPFMEADPRKEVKELYARKKIRPFTYGTGAPEWLHER